MHYVSEEKDKLKSLTDQLSQIKASSTKVKEWLAINKEICRQQRHLTTFKQPSSRICELKGEYIKLLSSAQKELEQDEDVQKYIKISNKVTSTLSSNSTFMREMKFASPELHAWIALNKKRAYYEEAIIKNIVVQEGFKNWENLIELVESLKQVNSELRNFRGMYKESVDKWEELYSLKSILM